MSDTARGLIIGVFVGLFGGLLIGSAIISLLREYSAESGLMSFIINYGQIVFVLGGIAAGAFFSNRMLQNMQQDQD